MTRSMSVLRYGASLSVALLGLLGGMAYGQGAPGRGGGGAMKVRVPVCAVTEAEDTVSSEYVGLVQSKEVVRVVPQVSGELLEVSFADGSLVKSGQTLYRIDDVRYRAAVKSCEAKVAEAKAKLAYGKSNLARTKTLFDKEVTTLDSYESVRSETEALAAQVSSAEAALVTAQEDLRRCVITSPIDGMVATTNVTRGNYVTAAGASLVTVFQMNPIRVRFSVSSRDFLSFGGKLEELQKGWECTVTLSDGKAYGKPGQLELVNYEANRNTDTVQLFALFENPDFQLLPNSTVTVSFARKTGRRLPAVPVTAVMHDRDGAYVWLLDEAGKASKRHVALGSERGGMQLVLSGLAVGDRVVSDGTHKVMAGAVIEADGRE